MAMMVMNGTELGDNRFLRNDRSAIRSIVDAGAEAAAERMRENIRKHEHVRTSDMLDAVRATEYHEFYGGGAEDVYPQGLDRKGVRNAEKAYVINYGRGTRRRTKKGKKSRMGDKFITADEAQAEEIVYDAMQAEADRLAEEMNRG